MAKARVDVEKEIEAVEAESDFVEVEHFNGAKDASFFGPGFRVQFVDGKASVTKEQVKFLKEAGLIK